MRRKLISWVMVLAMCLALLPGTAGTAKAEGSTQTQYNTVCGDGRYAAIDGAGVLWTWGSNSFGQLGNGTTVDSDVPVAVMENVVSVETSKAVAGMGMMPDGNVTAALKSDGTLWTWGYGGDTYTALGNGGGGNAESDFMGTKLQVQTVPVQILDNVASFSLGGYCGAAVKTDGSVWVWGHPGEDGSSVPVKVEGVSDVISVSAGAECVSVVKSDGTLWIWGYDDAGLVDSTTPIKCMDDAAVSVLDSTSLSSSPDLTVAAIRSDGSLWVWGHGAYEEPRKMMDNVVFVDVNQARHSVFSIQADGSLWEWSNAWDETEGMSLLSDTPVRVMDAVAEVSGNLLRKTDGTIWQYQNSSDGGSWVQLSLSAGASTTPAPKSGFSDVPDSSPFSDAVAWAVAQKITVGVTANSFEPATTCTHNHILTFLWRSQNSPDAEGGTDFEKAIHWAKANGIADAGVDGSASCTRADAVTYLWKLAGSPSVSSGTSFPDVSSDADCAEAVAWAVENEITSGFTDNTFRPNDTCTRGQITAFLYRAYA